jgi:hypothetical protein
MYTFSNYTKQLKSRTSVELTSLRWGHSQMRVAGARGDVRRVGGGASTHISTESSESEEGGGAVRWRLDLPTSWREGGGVVQLKGEANLS